ncbi:alpha/beta fold hydrolase [Williamsia sp. R60]
MGTTMGQVEAPDGTRISYRVAGRAADADSPALLLIHGWAQSSTCWGNHLLELLGREHRVIAMDLRGHGESGVPPATTVENFGPAHFAGDVAAVLAAEVGPGQPVFLLGWSYGGLVVCDHLATLGRASDTVAGVVLVGATTSMGRGKPGGRIGPAMRAALPDALSDDPKVAVAALSDFVAAVTPLGDGSTLQRFLGTSLATAPAVRSALFGRGADHDDVLAALDVPALVIHGTADAVADISCAEHATSLIPAATAEFWEGGGHAPFVDDPDTFARQVEGFVAESIRSYGPARGVRS